MKKNELIELLDRGIISLDELQAEMKRKEILKQHKYTITKTNDGKFSTYIIEDGKRKKRVRNTKKELEDYLLTVYDAKIVYTINALFKSHIKRQLEHEDIKIQTYQRCEYDYKYIEDEFCNRDIETLKAVEVADWIRSKVKEHQFDSKGAARVWMVVKKAWTEATRIGLSVCPYEDIRLIGCGKYYPNTNTKPQVLNTDEIAVFLQYLEEHPGTYEDGLYFIIFTGLREGELSGLKWECVGDGYIDIRGMVERYTEDHHVIHRYRESPKTAAGIRRVYISPELEEIIRRQPHDCEYVFSKDGKLIPPLSFTQHMYTICKRVGIGKRSPHKLRKTYASMLERYQVNPELLKNQMGHKDLSTTQRHYFYDTHTESEKKDLFNGIYSKILNKKSLEAL